MNNLLIYKKIVFMLYNIYTCMTYQSKYDRCHEKLISKKLRDFKNNIWLLITNDKKKKFNEEIWY